jgi:hypothetical protein
MNDAVSGPLLLIVRNLHTVRNRMNALARHTPPFKVRLDFLAVGDPGSRVPRDAPREERAEQSLTLDD